MLVHFRIGFHVKPDSEGRGAGHRGMKVWLFGLNIEIWTWVRFLLELVGPNIKILEKSKSLMRNLFLNKTWRS